MNQDNYASLEASRRLVDAGIVLKTDAYWVKIATSGWFLSLYRYGVDEYFPAPAWPEVWRELPERTFSLRFNSVAEEYLLWLEDDTFETTTDNPTDALIDLLIWVRKEAEDANRR